MITVGLTERWLFILKLSLFHNAIIYFERSNFHIFSCIPIEYEPKKVCKNTSLGDRMYWKKLVGECAILVRMKGATNHARKLNHENRSHWPGNFLFQIPFKWQSEYSGPTLPQIIFLSLYSEGNAENRRHLSLDSNTSLNYDSASLKRTNNIKLLKLMLSYICLTVLTGNKKVDCSLTLPREVKMFNEGYYWSIILYNQYTNHEYLLITISGKT